MEIKTYLNDQKKLVEKALLRYMLAAGGDFAGHIDTMRYSLFAGGKRIRPILCLAAARMVDPGCRDESVLPIACALECLHTYSLVHDDLPAMDDDDLRRGKPTNHAVYGEAAAILAGDGLQCFAFDLLSNPDHLAIDPRSQLEIIFTIARAAGPLGMVGGQSLDVAHEEIKISFDLLRTIHHSKTGALITASVLAGGIAAGAAGEQRKLLAEYGNAIGLAFQIVDDILNVESTTEQLGKTAGSDAKQGKATYPSFFGLAESKRMAGDAVAAAIRSLQPFGHEAEPLRELAEYILGRSN
ncbi:MAG: polyprenyl synthetase family protein [Desulfobulbaceae bacterium]|nr:polyprenyl synthetase family protein [Desulfobulbaceae bacterium]